MHAIKKNKHKSKVLHNILAKINIYVYLCSKNISYMEKNLLIELLETGEKVSLYSPRIEGEEYTEFEKFLLTYKD